MDKWKKTDGWMFTIIPLGGSRGLRKVSISEALVQSNSNFRLDGFDSPNAVTKSTLHKEEMRKAWSLEAKCIYSLLCICQQVIPQHHPL